MDMNKENSEYNNDKVEKTVECISEENVLIPEIVDNIGTKKKIIKNPKIFAGILVAVFVIAIFGLGVWAYPHISGKNVKDTNIASDSSKTPETNLPTSNKKFVEKQVVAEPVVNVKAFLGYWYIGETKERELSILDVNEKEVKFTLFYFRLNEIDNVVAIFDGNVARFSVRDNERMMKGTLTFQEKAVIVNITDSSYVYMPVETMTFDNWHNKSKVIAYGIEDDDPADVTTPYTICSKCKYVYETGTVCPACESGWPVSTVYCPTCGGGYCVTDVRHSQYCNYCSKEFKCCQEGTLHCNACNSCGASYSVDSSEYWFLENYGYCETCATTYVNVSTCNLCGTKLYTETEQQSGYCNSCISIHTCYVCNQVKSSPVFEGVCGDCAGPKCLNCGASQGGLGFIDEYCEFCYEELFGNGG